MRHLRIYRTILAIIFFAGAVAFLCIGPEASMMGEVAYRSQIILSTISVSLGATLVWLLLTFLLGRVYCSTVCPVGTISDFVGRIARKFPNYRPYRWKNPGRIGAILLVGYLLSLLLGMGVVAMMLEPWTWFRQAAGIVRPEVVPSVWEAVGAGAGAGIAVGIVVLVGVVILSSLSGRDFCTDYCPLGTALGAISARSVMHIEINPDACDCCGKCEEVCSAHCILTRERAVDNARCLRCFDCLAVCPRDAIRYRCSRHIPGTPIFLKSTSNKPC
ncbi:MAG: 4Fe-4S binding protein [Muribaculaceae bacterium]|nr:4Fe-4S binding protein [Muribaculaceae bacterium]